MTHLRKIIHIDMDAFYASIEQRDNPNYKNKPLVVGYSGSRGVIAAASYEARKYGVYSAMSSKMALKKCPFLIFTPARFDVYKEVSNQILDIFLEYTDLVEPLSLDEAYLDVTVNHKQIPYATTIAEEIKSKIFEQTKLTSSAGISYNKFLAKIASDVKKPNGLFVITPKQTHKFLSTLPIDKFYGVGKVTAKKMKSLGVNTGSDLLPFTKKQLYNYFGKAGLAYYDYVRGVDTRKVNPNRLRKSLGAENTFSYDIDKYDELFKELESISEDVVERLKENNFQGKTFTLKIKFSDFTIITRSKTLTHNINPNTETLLGLAKDLLLQIDISKKVRLLGISVKKNETAFLEHAYQLSLDFDPSDNS